MGSDNVNVDPAQQTKSRKAGSSRRTFIGRLAGGLAIGVPAFRVLAGSKPAYAKTASTQAQASPDACTGSCDPCAKVYAKYNGHKCQPYGISTCNSKRGGGTCIGYYTLYSSTITGMECGTETDDEGPCTG